MAKVRWGILGAAKIAITKVVPAMQKGTWSEVVGIASREPEKARRVASDLTIPKAYGSYEELLADPEIEAIYIPLPNSMHCEWSIKALEAGKHVLCEKPLSRHTAEVEAAFDAADRNGRLRSEAVMYRHNPQSKRARRLVDEGAIGELRLRRSGL